MTENDIAEERYASEIVHDAIERYGSYVIEDRALADVRDGLKPVQRRLLWSLWSLGRHSRAIPIKSATVAAECIGKYHPHGDAAAYDALVTMTWLRHPLAERHGGFGNPHALMERARMAAAPRYTETRLTPFADRHFDDIDIVPKVRSFTEEHEEPRFLPVRVPLLLVNGSQGIAVGMSAASIPPHNLREVIGAARHVLRHPECSLDDLLDHVKGPDHGRGVLLSRKDELRQLYSTGKGKLRYSCTYRLEDAPRKGVQRLVITGFAPGFRAGRFEEATVKLQQQKLLARAAIDDGSLKTGTRIVVEFTDPKVVRDRLVPLLETTVRYQMYALNGRKRPRLWPLRDMLRAWLNFRRTVEAAVLRRRVKRLRRRAGIEEARLKAMRRVRDVADVLRRAKGPKSAVRLLVKQLGVEAWQAEALLAMSISSLLRSDADTVKARLKEIRDELTAAEDDLGNIDSVVDERLREMLVFADKRGTRQRQSGLGELDGDAMHWVGATDDGRIDRFNEPPVRSRAAWRYVDLVEAKETVTVVGDRNVGQCLGLSHLDKLKDSGRLVGMASEIHEACLVVTRRGRYVAFRPVQKRASFPVMRLDEGDAIVRAVGLGADDEALVRLGDGSLVRMALAPGSSAKTRNGAKAVIVTRPNVKTKPIARGGIEVTDVLVRRAGEMLFHGQDEIGDDGAIPEGARIRRVGEDNIVIVDGRRQLLGRDETLDVLAQHGDVVIAPIGMRRNE